VMRRITATQGWPLGWERSAEMSPRANMKVMVMMVPRMSVVQISRWKLVYVDQATHS
jgi:hypothetical protein